MEKYIAGFRSDNKVNKIIASIYYGFIIIMGLTTTVYNSLIRLDYMLISIMQLIMPSLVLNFIKMFGNSKDKYENRKIFIHTFIAYMVVTISMTNAPIISIGKDDDVVDTSSTEVVESNIYDTTEEMKEENESLEIGQTIETPLGMGSIKPVYNGIKTEIIGKYVSIISSGNISEEELIEFMNESSPKLEEFNWVVVKFGDGTALDLSVLPFFNYCEYSYEDGFTNTMGAGHIVDGKVEYSTDL